MCIIHCVCIDNMLFLKFNLLTASHFMAVSNKYNVLSHVIKPIHVSICYLQSIIVYLTVWLYIYTKKHKP